MPLINQKRSIRIRPVAVLPACVNVSGNCLLGVRLQRDGPRLMELSVSNNQQAFIQVNIGESEAQSL
jgi:hypothetical protein